MTRARGCTNGSLAMRNSDFSDFGLFSANLGPETPPEGRARPAVPVAAESQPRSTILRQFRGNSEF